MIGLVRIQLAEKQKRIWFYVFLVIFLNSLITTTQLTWDYYAECHSFWNIVLNVTNNRIDILYVLTLIFILVMLESSGGNAWSQIVCIRSVTRRKFFVSILVAHGIQTALFVAMIPVSCYVLRLFYPITFQNNWSLMTAAGPVLTLTPLYLTLLSMALLFLRFFCLGLVAKLVTITTRVRALGIITYLLLSFGIDAGYQVFNAFPNKLSMLHNTLVSVYQFGEWSAMNVQYALIYWSTIVSLLICSGYYGIRRTDLSDKGV